MKKIKFKITKNLKAILAIASIVGMSLFAPKAGIKLMATAQIAIVGVGASLKSKGLYEKLDEGTKKYIDELDAVLKTIADGQLAKKDIDDAISAFEEKHKGSMLTAEEKKSFEEMIESVKKQAEELKKLKDRGLAAIKIGDPILNALNEKKDEFSAFLKSKKGNFILEVKDSAILQDPSTDIATHTIGLRVPGIGQLPVRPPFLEDIFPVVNCNLEFIRYVDQETAVRDAKNVAGAAASTHTTKLTWKERNIQITKVRDFIYVPVDMMEDYDFVSGEINNLLTSSVQLKVDNGLLLDDGVYPNLHSVDEAASEFDDTNTLGGTIEAWTNKVQSANIFDLCVAMASQIVALGKEGSYMPDTVLWNTIDKYKSMLVKDKNDNYILPPFVVRVNNSEYVIDNMRVRSNPNVPANSMYMFDSTKGTIYNRKGIAVEMSYENNDNFEREIVTIKAYRRMNLLIRNVNKNAFMKCSDVNAALAAIDSAV